MNLTTQELETLLEEDLPYFDLTTQLLGIGQQQGCIRYFTREAATICGTEEVQQLFRLRDITTTTCIAAGTTVPAGTELLVASGPVNHLQELWKTGQNILDHCSGIATKTKQLVSLVHQVKPDLPVLTTRKTFPGTKKLAIKAILAGGAWPHRLGLSESILIFQQHINFFNSFADFIEKVQTIRASCCEKKIIVELNDEEKIWQLCKAGVDGIQLDKLSSEKLSDLVPRLHAAYPSLILLAAGGITVENAQAIAQTGVNGLVTTSLYQAKPIDIGVKLIPA